jgi:hypothetical protein
MCSKNVDFDQSMLATTYLGKYFFSKLTPFVTNVLFQMLRHLYVFIPTIRIYI